jgi:23S rRNA pseudouridine2604 synthase
MSDISLNKFLSDTGVCSRREADKWIEDGRVTINGIVAKKGNRVTADDEVLLDGKRIKNKPAPIYLAFHKPRGVTSTTDPKDGTNLIDYLEFPYRIFPVGRLDKYSDGLLFLTNDGDVVNKILRAGNKHDKEYSVTVHKPVTKEFIHAMGEGVPILGTVTKKCQVKQTGKYTFKIILQQGLNRQIRRMCDYLGYGVTALTRTRIMNITIKGIPYGKWRNFTSEETKELMELVSQSSKTEEASKIDHWE